MYSPHSFPFVGDFPALRRRVAEGLERLLAPLAGAVVCVCQAEREVALRHRLAPAERLHVVYNGCDPCPPGVTADPRLAQLRAGGPVAAAIQVLTAQKSIDTLLRAAPLLFERMPDARLAVVGNGPLRGELEACAASLGLDRDERFAFLPFAPPAARYLLASDVYVLPSAWEAFPIGLLEAQACGVPQVATDVGGTGEAVSVDTGLLVAPHDPPALAAAIGDLLADDERRARLGERLPRASPGPLSGRPHGGRDGHGVRAGAGDQAMRASEVGVSHGLTPLKGVVKGTLAGKMLLAAYRQRRAPAQVARARLAARRDRGPGPSSITGNARYRAVVVIPAGPGEWPALEDTIESVLAFEGDRTKIVVADDMTLDCRQAAVRARFPQVDVVRSSWPAGGPTHLYPLIADACQAALRRYEFDVLIKLDADALLTGPGLSDAAARGVRSQTRSRAAGDLRAASRRCA